VTSEQRKSIDAQDQGTDRTVLTSPGLGRKWRYLGLVVVALVVVVLARALVRNWLAVESYPWSWTWQGVILSVFLVQLSYLTWARSWRSILRAVGIRLHLTRAYWIFYISNIGRYIPGKVWQVGAVALIGRKLGLSGRDLAASMIVHLAYFLPVGVAMSLSSGTLPSPYNTATFQVAAWTLTVLTACAALFPHAVLSLARPVATRLGVTPERWRMALVRRLAVAVQTAFAWLAMSLGFAALVISVTPLGMDRIPGLARAFILSHIVGYVALFAPGGLGVREGTLALLLQPMVGLGPATAIALVSRAWATLNEALSLVIALGLANRDRGAEPAGLDPVDGRGNA